MHKVLVHAQDSCACTRFLCMHNTLVHAQHSCACTGNDQGLGRSQALDPRPFWVPGLVPGPWLVPWPLGSLAQCVVHAQECCACTRILCMHKNLDVFDKVSNFSWYVLVSLFHLCIIRILCLHNNKYCSDLFPQRSDFLVHSHLHSRLRRIQ